MSYSIPTLAVGTASNTGHLRRLQQSENIEFSLKPTWGTSRLRDLVETSNSGTIAETGGEIKVATGTDAAGSATLTSRERGQYRSGTWMEPSMGIRIPNADSLSGDQEARFGYYDDNNGFGYGVDSTGVFTFRRNAGTDTIYRPADWSEGELTPQHLIDGLVCHVVFRWYGHGPVRWYVEPKENEYADEQEIDQQIYKTELNITDPNQPITVEADNGGTGGSSLDVFVGGRQISLWGEGVGNFSQRNTAPTRRAVDISSSGTWESAMAIRKKPTFAGRDNSVRAVLSEVEAIASKDSEVRMTYDATVSSITWKDAGDGDMPAGETAIEQNDGAFTTDSVGVPLMHSILGSSKTTGPVEERDRIPLGDNTTLLIQIRSDDSSTTFDLLSATIEEQW